MIDYTSSHALCFVGEYVGIQSKKLAFKPFLFLNDSQWVPLKCWDLPHYKCLFGDKLYFVYFYLMLFLFGSIFGLVWLLKWGSLS